MYTEGYISKVEVTKEGICNFWIDPHGPFRVKFGEMVWTLAVNLKDSNIVKGRSLLFPANNPSELFRGGILDKTTLLALQTGHCKVGIEFDDNLPHEVVRLVCM